MDTEDREGFTEYRHFPARIHKTERDFESVGLDTISGGAADDVLFGDNAEVKPVIVAETPTEQLRYAASAIDTRQGSDDLISGGSGNDIVFAQSGEDVVYGNDGNDTLYGDRGRDELFGDAGVDEIRGGSHRDVINDDEEDSRALQGGGNGNDEIDVAVEPPWGDIVASLYFGGETLDPHSDLWATFAQDTEE